MATAQGSGSIREEQVGLEQCPRGTPPRGLSLLVSPQRLRLRSHYKAGGAGRGRRLEPELGGPWWYLGAEAAHTQVSAARVASRSAPQAWGPPELGGEARVQQERGDRPEQVAETLGPVG